MISKDEAHFGIYIVREQLIFRRGEFVEIASGSGLEVDD